MVLLTCWPWWFGTWSWWSLAPEVGEVRPDEIHHPSKGKTSHKTQSLKRASRFKDVFFGGPNISGFGELKNHYQNHQNLMACMDSFIYWLLYIYMMYPKKDTSSSTNLANSGLGEVFWSLFLFSRLGQGFQFEWVVFSSLKWPNHHSMVKVWFNFLLTTEIA